MAVKKALPAVSAEGKVEAIGALVDEHRDFAKHCNSIDACQIGLPLRRSSALGWKFATPSQLSAINRAASALRIVEAPASAGNCIE